MEKYLNFKTYNLLNIRYINQYVTPTGFFLIEQGI